MRRILSILFLVLTTALAAFAQGPPSNPGQGNKDDHDNGPVQSGYAVVTPSGASSNLVVFEAFGMRSNNGNGNGGSTQAGVLPPGLTTNAVLFVDSSGRLSKNLGVAIVNPNDAAVTVALTLRKADGTQVATTNVSVPKHEQVSKFVTQLFTDPSTIPSDFTGTLAVTATGTSPLPISVIGLRFRGSNFSTLPATSLSNTTTVLPTIATGVGGAGAVLLPQFAAGGGWATELVIVNTGSSSATARVDLFKSNGTALSTALNGQTGSSFTNLTIPAGGVLILAPRDSNGDDDF